MGNKNDPLLNVLVIGGEKEIINQIFPTSLLNEDIYEIRKFEKYIECFKENEEEEKKNQYIKWKGYIYPEINDANFEKIFESLKEKIMKNHKNIILKFGKKNSNYIIDYMNLEDEITKNYLPQIAIVTNENFSKEEGLYDNRYLSIIKEITYDKSLTKNNIINYLWEKDCYYNERGNLLSNLTPYNTIKHQEISNTYLNIMITGISRAGKSTLINILSEKLVSLESPDLESITNKITEYVIYKKINDNKTTGIKLIDTPGLTYIENKRIDTTKLVIKSIKNTIMNCKDSKNDIHMIYFVLKPNENLENHKKFFQFLIDTNKERKNKIPIIFVINFYTGIDSKNSLKKFLKKNDFNSLLYEEEENITDDKKLSFREKIERKKKNNENNLNKDNIIGLNLLSKKTKNNIIPSFGIDLLLKKTLEYIQKTNNFDEKDFSKLREIKDKFEYYNKKTEDEKKLNELEENEYSNLKKESQSLISEISNKYSLFEKSNNISEIAKNAEKDSQKYLYYSSILGFCAGLIPIPFLDLPVLYPIYVLLFIQISKCYSINLYEINFYDIAKLIFGFAPDVNLGSKTVNLVGDSIGQKIGNNIAKDIGEKQVKKYAKIHLRLVKKSKHHAFTNGLQNVSSENISFFNQMMNYLSDLLPTFKNGVEKGITNTANDLGQEVASTIIKNSKISKNVIKGAGKKSTMLSEKIISEGTKKVGYYSKFIPIVGSLIGGVMDSYSSYSIGKDIINYCNDYIRKTMGCEYILNQKEFYDNIFEMLNLMSNKNYWDNNPINEYYFV